MAIQNLGGVLGWTPDTRFTEVDIEGQTKTVEQLVGYFGGGGVEPTLNVGKYRGIDAWIDDPADAVPMFNDVDQAILDLKADKTDIQSNIDIVFSDLTTSTTYTNILLANRVNVPIAYKNPTTPATNFLNFNASGVTTLPFTAVTGFTATIFGTTGVLSAYEKVVDSVKIANPGDTVKNGITEKPGNYVNQIIISSPGFIAGSGVLVSNGNLQASGSNNYTVFIAIPAGYSHVRVKMLTSGFGGAFYNSSQVFISGFTGTNVTADYLIPSGAAFIRTTRNTAQTIAEATPYFVNIITVPENNVAYFRNGVATLVFGARTERFNNAIPNTYVGEKALAVSKGVYWTKLTTITSFNEAGAINYTTGNNQAGGGFFRTGFIDVRGYNRIEVALPLSTGGSLCFYDINNVYISGQYGTNGFVLSYDINTLPNVVYARMATNVGFTAKLIADFYLKQDNIALIENGSKTIFPIKLKSQTPIISIADLPLSNGSDISQDDTYIDSTTGILTTKLT